MHFHPEFPIAFDKQNKTGVLLLNLGSPQAPTPEAVRPFLRQFLSDPRVIERHRSAAAQQKKRKIL